MKKYRIKLNDEVYEIEVEEMGTGSEIAASTTAPAPAPKAPAAPVKKEVVQPSGDGEPVNAPMPGSIVAVKVNAGDDVKAGDVLVILEAMKMENEIVAPRDGKVASVVTSKGSSVSLGDVLVTLA